MSGPPPEPWNSKRRRRLVMLALVAAGLAWICGVAIAVVAARHAPDKSALDTELKGVEEPKQVEQPTTPTTPPTPGPAPAAQVEGPCWPVYGRTPARTSDAADLDRVVPRRKLWQVRIGIMEFPPSFCDGVIYVNSQRGFTWAIEAASKKVLWKRKTATLYDSTPAVTDTRVIVGMFTPGGVQALDRRTGRRLWQLRTGGAVEASPVVVNGLVYVTSKDRRVYAISEKTGRVAWAFRTGGEVKDSPSVVGGRVYVGNYAAEVFSLDARTGAVKWRIAVGGVRGDRIYSSVPVSGRAAYFVTVRGSVYAVDTRNGRTRWQQSIPGYVYSTPAISGGVLYIGNYQGEVYAFDVRNGRRLWKRTVGGTISGSPTVIGKVVYVSSLSRSRTWGLNARTGRVVWEYPDGRYVSGIATDKAFYMSMGSYLSRWTG